jgi:acyl carrier protein
MAVATEVPEEWRAWRQQSVAQGLASREGVEAFRRIVGAGLTLAVVSTVDLASRQAENDRLSPLAGLDAMAAAGAAGAAGATPATGATGATSRGGASPGAAATHPRPPLATAYVPPRTADERTIAAVWQEVLGVEPVGLHDNFFELGGNSLAGLRLVQRLRERLHASLSEVSLYEAPTVGALARLIAVPLAAADEPATAASATAEQESRQRGERRKARLLGRRGAAAAEAAPPDEVLTQPGERTK